MGLQMERKYRLYTNIEKRELDGMGSKAKLKKKVMSGDSGNVACNVSHQFYHHEKDRIMVEACLKLFYIKSNLFLS